MAKVTEKSLKDVVLRLNHRMKDKGLDYGLSVERTSLGYALYKVPRDPAIERTRYTYGKSASELDAMLWGTALVVNALPDKKE